MSARDRLWELYQTPDSASAFGDALDAMLKEHAHELAERQRAAIKELDLDDHWAFYYRASDVEALPNLIDPEVES